jgi:hypothetical protein
MKFQPMNKNPKLIALLAVFGFSVTSVSADPTIKGRLTDQSYKGVPGVKVSVWDQEANWSVFDVTDADGRFSVTHKPCDSCFVEMSPKKNGDLASALIEDVPGKLSRNFIVQLRHGFTVKGSVLKDDGTPAKGVVVKISADEEKEDESARMHGGGATVTAKNGTFSLVLTAGHKLLTVINENYPDHVKHLKQKFQVTSDGALENIVLPRKK